MKFKFFVIFFCNFLVCCKLDLSVVITRSFHTHSSDRASSHSGICVRTASKESVVMFKLTFIGRSGSNRSSGSSGRVRGAEKHEIYAATFGGHLFYDLFSQNCGGTMVPWAPPWIRY